MEENENKKGKEDKNENKEKRLHVNRITRVPLYYWLDDASHYSEYCATT